MNLLPGKDRASFLWLLLSLLLLSLLLINHGTNQVDGQRVVKKYPYEEKQITKSVQYGTNSKIATTDRQYNHHQSEADNDIDNNVLQPSHIESSDADNHDGNNSNKNNENDQTESSTSAMVIRLLKKAFRFLNIKQMVKNAQQGKSSSSATCLACKITMTGMKYLIDYGRGLQDVAYVTKYLCNTLNIQTDRVCNGYVDIFMEEFVVVMSQVNISSNEMCGFLFGETCNYVQNPSYKWNLPLPDKPFFSKPLFRWPFRMAATQFFKVLQISDLHIDLEYAEHSNAVCGEPLCCRSSSPGSSSDKLKPSQQAGYWGDYRDCDVPLRLVEETFKTIRQNHPDIDYIVWTGDIPPHDIWNQTKASQLNYIELAGRLFDKYFSHIPIYPAVGNHESLPMNSFPILLNPAIKQKYSKQWLYDKLTEQWLRWLPEETRSTIERGAYFATRVKKGLKMISLNTNFCNTQNWWILLNGTDPGQQLEWLIQQLAESERLGEMVQIIGHVPPGSNDCVQIWSHNYNQIVNRFASIIKGQFFGHTHNDEFEIFYKEVRPDVESHHETTFMPTNVAYVGPSITTFGNVNPGYRIYLIDQETFDIMDHVTYFLNLTEANLHRNLLPLQYRMSYSARETYDMNTLSPTEWHRLVMRMRTPIGREDRLASNLHESQRLFKYFHQFYYNLSDDIGKDNKCDDESCKYDLLCRLLMAHSHNSTLCEHFLL